MPRASEKRKLLDYYLQKIQAQQQHEIQMEVAEAMTNVAEAHMSF